ncbi:hypothetical protein UFOVP849_14 [uncultured Caudovirales phage]|uniref:Uncharacterized protein n=1 Tax=uncultured Caudovirales phage TaxID=2100421 RepID=A0A6J5PEM4_9CAUD|nr:hypothetical protein UFOVP849_14 [uncultured Caudovirales phage]
MPTFRQYMEMPDTERESAFKTWCKTHKRKPTEDGVGDDFLDDYCNDSETEQVVQNT